MSKEQVLLEIVSILDIDLDQVAKRAHGKTPQILLLDLITRIIDNPQCTAHTLFPEISEQTFNRMMRKVFPDIKLNGGQETWRFKLLALAGYKHCGKCNRDLEWSSFHKDSDSAIGIASICKECKSIQQQGQYKKYLVAHKRSYDKNYGAIRERQNKYKGERSLRIVPWSESEQIAEFYQKCPDGYQVDHILPLKGKMVSGLHVLSNLQYLTKEDNLSKGNRVYL